MTAYHERLEAGHYQDKPAAAKPTTTLTGNGRRRKQAEDEPQHQPDQQNEDE